MIETKNGETLDADRVADETSAEIAKIQAEIRAEAKPLPPVDKFDESTVVLTITVHCPGNTKRINDDDAEVHAADGTEPERESLNVSKDLFKSILFKQIRKIGSQARGVAKTYALSSGDYLAPGTYLVPVAAVDKIFERLDQIEKDRLEAIDKFLAAYPQIVTDAQIRLKGVFDQADYPAAEVLRAAFLTDGKAIRTRIRVRGNVPSKGISRAIYDRELKNAENEVQGLMREVRDGLRAGLLKLVTDLVDKVKSGPGEDGKRFVVGPKLDRVKAFLEALPLKDVTKDGELAGLAAQARQILDGVTVDSIRDNEDVIMSGDGVTVKTRDRIVSGLSDVAKSLDGMVENKPARKITFEEDEVKS